MTGSNEMRVGNSKYFGEQFEGEVRGLKSLNTLLARLSSLHLLGGSLPSCHSHTVIIYIFLPYYSLYPLHFLNEFPKTALTMSSSTHFHCHCLITTILLPT